MALRLPLEPVDHARFRGPSMRNLFLLSCFAVSMVSGCYYDPYPYPYPYPGYVVAQPYQGSLTISNQSQSTLTQLHFTLTANATWGPNLLSGVLRPGEQSVASVDCGVWDVLVGDEFGRQCVLPGIELCQTNEVWVVSEDILRTCNAF